MSKYLITGGTGSFGSAMVEKLLKDDTLEEIVIFSRDEKKQHDMRHTIDSSKVRFIVGDIRDRDAIKNAVKGIDYVFHAAALKQVPTGEFFPLEMVKTNIIGTQNILDATEDVGTVKKVVVLSTDKAVYPINAMGISKAMVEKLTVAKAQQSPHTKYCIVRYGNVMASRGSVIPLFVDQIREGKEITVTDPKMTRFLLSLDHAIDLVLLAIDKGEQGDVFIKKAPASTVEDLAAAMIKLFNASSKVKIIGTRAGEKVHETLATRFELIRSEDLKNYFRIKCVPAEGPSQYFEEGGKQIVSDDYTSENTERLDVEGVQIMLASLDFIKKQMSQW